MKNISVFSDTSDYLPILNAVLITDLIVIALLLGGLIQSRVLTMWYSSFGLSAVIADVLIIFIGILIARFLYPRLFSQYALWKFIALALVIQISHDILFYLLTKSIPRGQSKIMDVFKDYGKEMGVKAIMADSGMMVSSILIASFLKGKNLNINLITLIVSVYIVPYFIYSM